MTEQQPQAEDAAAAAPQAQATSDYQKARPVARSTSSRFTGARAPTTLSCGSASSFGGSNCDESSEHSDSTVGETASLEMPPASSGVMLGGERGAFGAHRQRQVSTPTPTQSPAPSLRPSSPSLSSASAPAGDSAVTAEKLTGAGGSPPPKDTLVLEGDQVKFGTPEALVVRLTSESGGGNIFLHQYLLTHSAHTTSLRLLELLSDRFNTAPPAQLSAQEAEQYTKTVIQPIRIRVFAVLKTWVEKLWNSSTDAELIAKAREFCGQAASTMTLAAPQMLKTIDKATSGEETQKTVMFDRPPPFTILPVSVGLGVPFTLEMCSFELLNAKEIARQMTLVEQNLFKAIKPWELIGLAWTKKDKSLAPNIAAITRHFNNMSRWVMGELCACDDLRKRIKMTEKFIELCGHLDELHNYNGILEIISGFGSSPVHRLKKTFAGVSPALSDTLARLSELVSQTRSYAALRQCLHNLRPPCIPYPGLYQTDMTFIEDGNKTFVDDLVNFAKCRLLATVILEIQQYQQAPYNIEPHPIIREWLMHLGLEVSEDTAFKQSLIIEPREKADASDSEKTDRADPSAASDQSSSSLISLVEQQAPSSLQSAEPATGGTSVPAAVAGAAAGVATADGQQQPAQVPVLFPGERSPTHTLLPAKMTVGEAVKKLLEKWSKVQHKYEFSAAYRRHVYGVRSTSATSSPSYALVRIPPPSAGAPCAVVADTCTIGDMVAAAVQQPQKKGSGDLFALVDAPVLVDVIYVHKGGCASFTVPIDTRAPLLSSVPLLEAAGGVESEFVLAHYENDLLVKWLNSNHSYAEHGLKPQAGSLVAFSLEHFFAKETEGQLKNRFQLEGATYTYLSLIKARFGHGYRPAVPDFNTGKRAKPSLLMEKRRWFLLADGFLFVSKDKEDPSPSLVLPLEYYEVTLAESSNLCILLKPIMSFKSSSTIMISCQQEEITRSWLTNLRHKSQVHEQTTLFGVDLRTLAVRSGTTSLVPTQLQEIVAALAKRAMHLERLFVSETSNSAVERAKSQLDLGLSLDLDELDVYVIGDLLKLFLAELPEPLLTSSMFSKFSRYVNNTPAEQQPGKAALRELLQRVPEPHEATLRYVLSFLRCWCDSCGLQPQRVAALFGPLFLRPAGADYYDIPQQSQNVVMSVTQQLLIYCNELLRTDAELLAQFKHNYKYSQALVQNQPVQVFSRAEKKEIEAVIFTHEVQSGRRAVPLPLKCVAAAERAVAEKAQQLQQPTSDVTATSTPPGTPKGALGALPPPPVARRPINPNRCSIAPPPLPPPGDDIAPPPLPPPDARQVPPPLPPDDDSDGEAAEQVEKEQEKEEEKPHSSRPPSHPPPPLPPSPVPAAEVMTTVAAAADDDEYSEPASLDSDDAYGAAAAAAPALPMVPPPARTATPNSPALISPTLPPHSPPPPAHRQPLLPPKLHPLPPPTRAPAPHGSPTQRRPSGLPQQQHHPPLPHPRALPQTAGRPLPPPAPRAKPKPPTSQQ
eukprot:TRINITY_DN2028_c0_g1_i2.p1 TRINITY_DN2028_c0_g1~~TRINITY_DN2028_c0_g1_i2.p1  ORF type:complete len:1497 (+),score=442.67 TRINITY_DN2028_c0_g1_i2:24-4493(+)